jgi:hypothetical protein
MTMTTTIKAIGYVRVSTDEQAADGVSLAAQEHKIRMYAELYGIELVEVVVDAGQSAKTLDRPGLRRVLDLLRQRKVEGVIVAKLDRLTRSVADLNTLIDTFFCERAGRQLWSVADSIDTRTAAGRLVLNILGSVGQWERETIAERTRRGSGSGPSLSDTVWPTTGSTWSRTRTSRRSCGWSVNYGRRVSRSAGSSRSSTVEGSQPSRGNDGISGRFNSRWSHKYHSRPTRRRRPAAAAGPSRRRDGVPRP